MNLNVEIQKDEARALCLALCTHGYQAEVHELGIEDAKDIWVSDMMPWLTLPGVCEEEALSIVEKEVEGFWITLRKFQDIDPENGPLPEHWIFAEEILKEGNELWGN